MLNVLRMDIPGDFGFSYKVPLWIDQVNIDDTSINEFIDIINANYDHYKQWNSYNVLTSNHDYIIKLLCEIKQRYIKFTETYGVETKTDVWINGWFNLLKNGASLGKHYHAIHNNAYLSGTVILTGGTSNTIIHPPHSENMEVFDDIKISSIKNRLIFFPQWVYHSVENNEDYRISIGFDIHTNDSMEYYKKHNSNIEYPIKNSIRLFGETNGN